MNNPNTCYRQKSGLDVEDTGEDVLIYMEADESAYYLNGTAALVWRLCDGQRQAGEIVRLLAEAYPEEPSLGEDVNATFAQLSDQGVIEPV